jgi:mttA/Hcf106 family
VTKSINRKYETKSKVSHIRSGWHRTDFDSHGGVLLFSGRKLSQSAKALGQGIKSFKKMAVNTSEEINAK